MAKYQNCKLFKLYSSSTPDVYYGVTRTNLLIKKHGMAKKYKEYIKDSTNRSYCPSFEIFKHNDAEIILIKTFKCEDRDEYNKFLYDYVNSHHPNINNRKKETNKQEQEQQVEKEIDLDEYIKNAHRITLCLKDYNQELLFDMDLKKINNLNHLKNTYNKIVRDRKPLYDYELERIIMRNDINNIGEVKRIELQQKIKNDLISKPKQQKINLKKKLL